MTRLFWLLLFVYPITLVAQAPVLTFDEYYQEGKNYSHLYT